MAVDNGDVSMSIAREVDASNVGGEQVLASRLELCVANQVATAIDKQAKNSSGEASSAKKRKRVSKLRSQISEDFKLTLPGIDGELDGTVRGNSTTFVNFFHSTSGLTLKCGVQVYSALHHTGHRCFIGCGLPVVLKETFKASKYCSLDFTAVCSGYVVWQKNSVVHILITFVHNKEPEEDFMLVRTLSQSIHWPSQMSTYEWKDPRFPKAALRMQRKWVVAMDKAWRGNKAHFNESMIPVKNIGTAPVALAIIPVQKTVARRTRSRTKTPVALQPNTDTSLAIISDSNVSIAASGARLSHDLPNAPVNNLVQQRSHTQMYTAMLEKQLLVSQFTVSHKNVVTPLETKLAVEQEKMKGAQKEQELRNSFQDQILQMYKDQAATRDAEVAEMKKARMESDMITQRRLDEMTKTAHLQLSHAPSVSVPIAAETTPAPAPIHYVEQGTLWYTMLLHMYAHTT